MSALGRLRVISAHLHAPAGERIVTLDELATHKTAKSMWLAVDGVVYDMTAFLDDHPGGKRLPLKYAGTDATEAWHSMHRPEILAEYGAKLRVGLLAGAAPAKAAVTAGGAGGNAAHHDVGEYVKLLAVCERELRVFIDEENCAPILIRLAWHDAGTYDQSLAPRWPECGGANGSIRFEPELGHGANAGLKKAVLYLQPFKDKYGGLSWADLIQLAGASALAHVGGPRSPLRYGRVDVTAAAQCPPEGRLPGAYPPFPGNVDAATHLRQVFGRMGFSDSEIVALSGAHTLGRAFKERSGVVAEGYGKATATRFTHPETGRPRHDGAAGVGMAGGRSWTEQWLRFDNSYYAGGLRNGALPAAPHDASLLLMPTDAVLHTDPVFHKTTLRYAHDQLAFFADFASAHAKLAECGSKFEPPEGIPFVLP